MLTYSVKTCKIKRTNNCVFNASAPDTALALHYTNNLPSDYHEFDDFMAN